MKNISFSYWKDELKQFFVKKEEEKIFDMAHICKKLNKYWEKEEEKYHQQILSIIYANRFEFQHKDRFYIICQSCNQFIMYSIIKLANIDSDTLKQALFYLTSSQVDKSYEKTLSFLLNYSLLELDDYQKLLANSLINQDKNSYIHIYSALHYNKILYQTDFDNMEQHFKKLLKNREENKKRKLAMAA